jgi:uncharacterized OB-fold protein
MSCGCGNKCGPEFDADREGLSAEDMHKFDHDGDRCASCGGEMYDDVTQCPSCGHVVVSEGDSSSAKWVVVTAGVLVVAFVFVFVL